MNVQRDMKAPCVKNVCEIVYSCYLISNNSPNVNDRTLLSFLLVHIAAICDPPCVAGFCAEVNMCQCLPGYTGPTCSIAGKRFKRL